MTHSVLDWQFSPGGGQFCQPAPPPSSPLAMPLMAVLHTPYGQSSIYIICNITYFSIRLNTRLEVFSGGGGEEILPGSLPGCVTDDCVIAYPLCIKFHLHYL